MFYSRIASRVLATVSVLTLAACASTPEYVPADDPDDFGHYSTKLDDNRYRIVYNGARSTGLNATRDYALMRAAELTLRDGYDWFEVVDRETVTITERDGERPAMGFGVERAWYVERNCGLLSCAQSVRPWTTTRLDMDTGRSATHHSHMLEILMGKGEIPEKGGNYYNADSIARSLFDAM